MGFINKDRVSKINQSPPPIFLEPITRSAIAEISRKKPIEIRFCQIEIWFIRRMKITINMNITTCQRGIENLKMSSRVNQLKKKKRMENKK